MNCTHLNIGRFDMFCINFIKGLKLLNKLLFVRCVIFDSQIHLKHSWVKCDENVINGLLAVPDFYPCVVADFISGSINSFFLGFFEEHSPHVFLFVTYINKWWISRKKQNFIMSRVLRLTLSSLITYLKILWLLYLLFTFLPGILRTLIRSYNSFRNVSQ